MGREPVAMMACSKRTVSFPAGVSISASWLDVKRTAPAMIGSGVGIGASRQQCLCDGVTMAGGGQVQCSISDIEPVKDLGCVQLRLFDRLNWTPEPQMSVGQIIDKMYTLVNGRSEFRPNAAAERETMPANCSPSVSTLTAKAGRG